ncbi:MAG: hypothetical protein JSS66_13750 [Armatimonadetes bacterium]|nr:hypothetical protein [Armatimonadota bacterium]
MVNRFFLASLVLLLAGCGGGGGGGGGGTAMVNLQGRVIWIETGSGTNPASTVRAGQNSTTTDVIDGFFEFAAASGTTSVTVTYVPSSGGPIVRTFNFPAATNDVDLGDLYVGPQVVSLKGRIVSAADNSAVPGATIAIAGRLATSAGDGTFSVDGVAYSAANPAVFLGLDGLVTATNFFARHFSPESLATGGIVQIGSIALTPEGSNDPPPPPFDVQGTASPVGQGAGCQVDILQGSTLLRRVNADGAGKYTFWLPKGSYTLKATQGSDVAQTTFSVTDTTVIKTVNVSF